MITWTMGTPHVKIHIFKSWPNNLGWQRRHPEEILKRSWTYSCAHACWFGLGGGGQGNFISRVCCFLPLPPTPLFRLSQWPINCSEDQVGMSLPAAIMTWNRHLPFSSLHVTVLAGYCSSMFLLPYFHPCRPTNCFLNQVRMFHVSLLLSQDHVSWHVLLPYCSAKIMFLLFFLVPGSSKILIFIYFSVYFTTFHNLDVILSFLLWILHL